MDPRPEDDASGVAAADNATEQNRQMSIREYRQFSQEIAERQRLQLRSMLASDDPLRPYMMDDTMGDDDDDDDDDDDMSNDSSTDTPSAREHSYLPGSTYSVHSGGLFAKSAARRTRGSSAVQELAVMELPKAVIFPGDTLPIRVHEQPWIDFLKSKLGAAKKEPGQEVRFGVLARRIERNTEQARLQRQRSSWTRRGVGPRRLSRMSARLIAELGDNLDNDDDDGEAGNQDRVDNVTVVDARPPPPVDREVEPSQPSSAINDMPMEEEIPQSGGERDSALAQMEEEIVRLETASLDLQLAHVDGNDASGSARAPPPLSPHESIDDNGDSDSSPTSIPGLEERPGAGSDSHDEWFEERFSAIVGGSGARAQDSNDALGSTIENEAARDDVMVNHDSDDDGLSEASSGPPSLVARESSDNGDDADSYGSIPGLIERPGYDSDSDSDWRNPEPTTDTDRNSGGIGPPSFRNIAVRGDHYIEFMRAFEERSLGPREPYQGMVGTIVTVMYHHTEDREVLSDLERAGWPRRPQLIVTALGTSRFRIISPTADGFSRPGALKKFLVEELTEVPMGFPSLPGYLNRGAPTLGSGGSTAMTRQGQMVRDLSRVTPIPRFVYNGYWPWHLSESIRGCLERSQALSGVHDSLRGLEQDRGPLEPLRFGFWMAANLPLEQNEKLDLLRLDSTGERLRFILDKLVKAEEAESLLQCKSCGCFVAKASNMFTVGGAEGTTGNYVNRYGQVHQTITVREVSQDEVRFSGRAQTQDSWFPGYSWTVMSCVFCMSHLGWQFRRVRGNNQATSPDRPSVFYGLSAAEVYAYSIQSDQDHSGTSS